MLEQPAERDVLAERHQLALDVGLARPAARQPQHAGVAHRVGQQGADEHRPVDRVHRPGDRGVHLRVVPGVEIGRVLGPDHQGGRGLGARTDACGQALGGGRVVERDGGGPQQAGQAPRVRHVPLDGGHGGRRGAGRLLVNREQGARQRQPGGARERQQEQRPQAQTGPPPRDEQGPGQGGPGQRHQEAQQRRPADRGPRRGRRARLAHRQPAPRERVRPPAAQRLGAHPPARHRQRPGAQVKQQPLAHGEQREDHRLGDREREPCVPRHVEQPGQQRDEEGQPEHQPGQQRGAQAAPPQRHGQQRRAGRGERPDPDRREGGRQGQSAGQRDGQRPGQAQARGGGARRRLVDRPGLRPGLRGQSCRPGPRPGFRAGPVTGSGPGGARVPGWCSGPAGTLAPSPPAPPVTVTVPPACLPALPVGTYRCL